MDPQQKLLLQGALRALDDAGYVPNATPSFQTDTMGCYIGVATDDYLNVSLGFHSPALDPIIEPLERFCRGLQFSEPKYPIRSSYHGCLLTSEDLTSEYIPKQTRHMV